MNICGKNVNLAKNYFGVPNKKIIVLHDCLETKLGEIKLNQGNKSFKGHNGLRSIAYELDDRTEFTRIAIGIGRPVERTP